MAGSAVEIGKVAIRVIPDTRGFRDDVKDFLDKLEHEFELTINIELDSASKKIVQAEVAALSRRRDVTFAPKMDKVAYAKVASTLAALSGGRALKNIATDFAEWVGNLDKAVPKIAGAGIAIGNLSSAAITGTSNLFSLAASLATIGQAGLALPGLLGGVAIGLGATVAVLKDFNDRLPSIKERLADLQDVMSDTFWDKAQEPFERLADTIFPLLTKNLTGTSSALGSFFANLANSAEGHFGESLTRMFDDLNESIRIAGEYTDNFVGVLDKLGQLGAQNLPDLAKWFGEISRDFDDWLGRQGTDGLQKFVDTGIDALQDLGAITRDFFATWASIAQVAEETGASTLETLRDTMAHVRETVESPGFQEALRNAFTGARQGLEEFTDAAGAPFQKFLKTLAKTFTEILPSVGRAGGDLFGGVFDALARPKLHSSIIEFFEAIEHAIDNLVPVLPAISDALASVIDVISTLTEGIAESLADALAVAAPALDRLAQKAEPLAEQLNILLDTLINLGGPALNGVVDSLGAIADIMTDVLEVVNAVLGTLSFIPGVKDMLGILITVGLTVAATTWLGAAIRGKITALGAGMVKLGSDAQLASTRMTAAGTAVQRFGAAITARRSAMVGFGLAATVAASQVGLTNTALFGMIGGAINPWIGAVGAAIGFTMDMVNSQSALENQIKSLNAVWDDAGATLEEKFKSLKDTAKVTKDAWEDINSTSGFGDFFADVAPRVNEVVTSLLGMKTASELSAEEIRNKGNDLNTLTRILDETSKAAGGLGLSFRDEFLGANSEDRIKVFGDNFKEAQSNIEHLTPAMEYLGLTVTDLLESDDSANLVRQLVDIDKWLQSAAGKAEAVQLAFDGLDDPMKTNAQAANELRAAFDALLAPNANLITVTDNWNAALRDLPSRLAENGTALRGQGAAAEANRALIIEYANSLAELAATNGAAGKSGEQTEAIFARQRQAFIDAATGAGISKKALDDLLNSIGLTPDLVTTKFVEEGADKVAGKAKEVGESLSGIFGDSKTVDADKWAKDVAATVQDAKQATTQGVQDIAKALELRVKAPDMGKFLNGLAGSLNLAKTIAAVGGFFIGRALQQGIINGFAGTSSILASQAASAVTAAVAAGRAAGDINSPSRETEYIGAMLGEGLVVGMESKSKKITAVAARITQDAIKGYARIGNLLDKTLDQIDSKASKAYKKSHAADIKRLRQLGNEYDKLWEKLKNLIEQQREFMAQTRDTIIEAGNPTTFDILTPDGIVSGMQDAVKQAEDFARVIDELVKKGLNKTTLKQILAAGPEVGGAVAESILTAGVDKINALQAQLAKAAGVTASISGDYLFGSLIQQAQGDVDTLLKKLKPLSDRLRQFAKDLVGALRDQLNKEFGKSMPGTKAKKVFVATRVANPTAVGTPVTNTTTSGSAGSWTLNYYAASSSQLSAEEELFGAVRRARMVV
jgi:hypothetical protein